MKKSILFALMIGGMACTSAEPPTEAEAHKNTLLTFRGFADLSRGTLVFEPNDPTGTQVRGLDPVPIEQDGTPGSGTDNRVELATESTGQGMADCQRDNSFCGAVTLRSFYIGQEIRGAHIELTTMVPPTGNTAFGDTPDGFQLTSILGLWSYGNLDIRTNAPANAATRTWKFDDFTSTDFTFLGRVMGDLVPAGNQPEDCNAPGDDDVPPDGFADCADSDCATHPACNATETACGNGHDDDDDSQLDCDDSDCTGDPACPTLIGGPHAVPTANPNPVGCLQPVTFDGSGSFHDDPGRALVRYDWDFGDGQIDSGVAVPHPYDRFGLFNASLTVVDDWVPANTDTIPIQVDVSINLPPQADPGGPYLIVEGSDLQLDGSRSFDPDVPCGDAIIDYQWSVGGIPFNTGGPISVIPFHLLDTLPRNTDLPVELLVTDSLGMRNGGPPTTLRIARAPVAAFRAIPNPSICDQPVDFDATGSDSGDPNVTIVDYDWDFGYGPRMNGPSPTVQHTFMQLFIHQVTLTITTSLGSTDQITLLQEVIPQPPIADAGGPYAITVGQDLLLDGSGSFEPDMPCGDSIVTYIWLIDRTPYITTNPILSVPWADLAALPVLFPIQIELTVEDSFGMPTNDFTTLIISR